MLSSPVVRFRGTPWCVLAYVGVFLSGPGAIAAALDPHINTAFKTGDDVRGTPLLLADGRIAIGSVDGKLYFLNSCAFPLQSFETVDGIISSPQQLANGTLVFGSGNGHLYFLGLDGKPLAEFKAAQSIEASPAVLADGNVAAASLDGSVYFLDPNGALLSTFVTGGPVTAPPLALADGGVAVGGNDKSLTILNADGSLRARIVTAGAVGPAAQASDGTIVARSRDSFVYFVNPDGTLRAKSRLTSPFGGNPGIAPDGRIFVAAYDGHVYVFDTTGKQIDAIPVDHRLISSPAFLHDGTLVQGTLDSRLVFLPPKSRTFVELVLGKGTYTINRPAVTPNDELILGSSDGNVYFVNPYAGASPCESP